MMRTMVCSCLMLGALATQAQVPDAPEPAPLDTLMTRTMGLDSASLAELMRALEALPRREYTYDELHAAPYGYGIWLEPMYRPPLSPQNTAQALVAALEEALRLARELANGQTLRPLAPAKP